MSPSFARRVHAESQANPTSSFDACVDVLDEAAAELYAMDPRILSIGITSMPEDRFERSPADAGYGLRVLRRVDTKLRGLAELDPRRLTFAGRARGLAVEVHDVATPIRPLLRASSSTLDANARPLLAEQQRQRPLCAGLQLQNWDSDAREGLLAAGEVEIGTLGLVLEAQGGALLISNNHVLAGQNRARPGDRIAQAGGEQLQDGEAVARLERFVALKDSPTGAHPRWGNVIWNRVDAAVARVSEGFAWQPGYLAHHRLPTPSGAAIARIGDEVFKVGRTTGLRRGRVVSVAERVGPVSYAIGDCWFRDSFCVESLDGRPFSEAGDSGAAIVRWDGEVLGLVYAGNGEHTFGCPMSAVLDELALGL